MLEISDVSARKSSSPPAAISAGVRSDPLASAAVGPAYSAGAELEVCKQHSWALNRCENGGLAVSMVVVMGGYSDAVLVSRADEPLSIPRWQLG